MHRPHHPSQRHDALSAILYQLRDRDIQPPQRQDQSPNRPILRILIGDLIIHREDADLRLEDSEEDLVCE